MIIHSRPSPHPISNCKEATKMQIRIASRWQPSNQATKQPRLRLRQRKWRGRDAFNNHRFHHSCKILQHRHHLLFIIKNIIISSSSLSSKLLTSTPFPESPHHNDIVTFKARSMTRLVRLRDSTSEEEEALETTSRAVWRKKLKLFFVDNRARSS